ncbi:MAG: hypothetical protein KC766_11720 [Myxococcales bacterium]|nr:hypothetical protein [Myxococcales bacterium]
MPSSSSMGGYLEAYLSGLPHAEQSYPDCCIKGSLVAISLRTRQLPSGAGVPDFLRRFERERWTSNEWVPIVQVNSWVAALLDHDFLGNEQAYLAWNYEINREFATSPMYRLFYKLAPPRILVRTLTLAFSQYFRGIVLDATISSGKADLVVTQPAKLYPELMQRGFAEAFRAALDSAGARGATAELVRRDERSHQVHCTWR